MRFALPALLLPGILGVGGVSQDPNAPVVADMPAPRAELIESGLTFVRLSWNAVVGASEYVVYRNDLRPLSSPRLALTATSFTHRANNDDRLMYTYTVVAQ